MTLPGLEMNVKPRVEHGEPGRVNLLGFILQRVLEQSLASSSAARRVASATAYDVAITASRMSCTLVFESDRVVITPGVRGPVAACLQGGFNELLEVMEGRSAAWSVLRGRLKVSGNPLKLRRLLPLFRVREPA